MILESEKVTINAKANDIIDFLKVPQNLYELLPKDNVSDFQADDKQCSFKVQGGIVISLVENGFNEDALFLTSGEKTPFPFKLEVKFKSISETETEGNIHFDGEVNMFLKMMVEKPLLNLFNYMSKKMKERFQ